MTGWANARVLTRPLGALSLAAIGLMSLCDSAAKWQQGDGFLEVAVVEGLAGTENASDLMAQLVAAGLFVPAVQSGKRGWRGAP